ncbi:hypothetical protein, partial [Nocardia asiatica]|uniref:hypothetical protein n=1 Tax=Nocardia asiatica TaxID=209252 RepID=UPI002456DE90
PYPRPPPYCGVPGRGGGGGVFPGPGGRLWWAGQLSTGCAVDESLRTDGDTLPDRAECWV